MLLDASATLWRRSHANLLLDHVIMLWRCAATQAGARDVEVRLMLTPIR